MERTDNYIQQDNTRVERRLPFKIKLTKDQLQKLQLRKLQQASAQKQGRIYDTAKAEYYKKIQIFIIRKLDQKLIKLNLILKQLDTKMQKEKLKLLLKLQE